MSTVTPVTIKMTPHGIRWIACDSFTVRSNISAAAMTSPIIPTFMPSPATVAISTTMPAVKSALELVERDAAGRVTTASFARRASR